MKKIILVLIAISITLAFSGCSGRVTPSVAATVAQMYDTTRTIYVKGQEIVVINADLLDQRTLDKLKEIDEAAKIVESTVKVFTADEAERYEALRKKSKELQKYFDSKIIEVDDLDLILEKYDINEILDNYDRMEKTIKVIER